MSDLAPAGLLALAAWGSLVGLDLASWPQLMLSRPIVAGGVAGLLLGDPVAGVTVGGLLELFALDVLPIGATRYPDFGVAALAGVALAAGHDTAAMLGPATALGLVLALGSRPAIEAVRRGNARAASRAADALAAGDVGTVTAVHLGGIRRDLLRALATTIVGVAAALALRPLGAPPPGLALPLLLVAVAGGLAAAVRGAIRSTSQGGRIGWVVVGVAGGILVVAWG